MKTLLTLILCLSPLLLVAQANNPTEVEARLAVLQSDFQTVFQQSVTFSHEVAVGDLNLKFQGALDRAQEDAARRGDLDSAVVYREEKTRITESKGVPDQDAPDTPSPLRQLRATYRTAKAKLDADRAAAAEPLLKAQDQKLADYQTLLTTQNRLDDALKVKAARDALGTSLQRLSAAATGADPAADGYLGHLVWSPKVLAQFPKESNLVIDMGWIDGGDAVIQEAKRLGLKVILGFSGETLDAAERTAIPLAVANHDVVLGLMWRGPYFAGFTPADLTAFGNKVHQAMPKLQFWGAFVEKPRGRVQTLPVPPEVDAIVVISFFAPSPDEVQQKAADTLPGWMSKANGRPVLLEWTASGRKPAGLVPETQPGTLTAMQTARDEAGAVGLILGQLGENDGIVGLDEKRELLTEIKEKITRKPAAKPKGGP
ncbi:MAG: hypothetical protein JNK37_02000 [Verrucomicrobiales bacterium]|nr:hypothetical protein [Verrucomicrobiales bacterium]